MRGSTVVSVRQHAETLWRSTNPIPINEAFQGSVMEVRGYVLVNFLVISDQPVVLDVEEANTPSDPLTIVASYPATLDANGRYVVREQYRPTGPYARIVLSNSVPQAIGQLDLAGIGLAHAGGGDGGGGGAQGFQGTGGPSGAQGSIGFQGSTGSGAQGAQGELGSQGTAGATGPTGPVGPTGATGATGAAGPQGDIGVQGSQGTSGPQGILGTQGVSGSQGNQGSEGTQGALGTTGSQGVLGPQGLIGAQGGAPRARTIIVAADGTGDALDIASGMALMPATGGILCIREGTYNVTGSIALPAGSTVIEGHGPGNCTITTGFSGPIFVDVTGNQEYIFKDLTLQSGGNNPLAQIAGGSRFTCENVDFRSTNVAMQGAASTVIGRFDKCETNGSQVGTIYSGSSGDIIFIDDCFFGIASATPISGTPQVFISNSRFDSSVAATLAVNSGSEVSGSLFTLISLVCQPECTVVGCNFNQGAVALTGSCALSGCRFENTSTGVSVTGQRNVVSGISCDSTVGVPVNEPMAGGNDLNSFDAITPFAASVVTGPNSRINGWRRDDITNTTSGVFVTQTSRTHPFGLAGAGSIRNTGGNALEVEETATGLNGVTDSLVTNVASGAAQPLSLVGAIGNASPPYTSYAVAVRDLGAGTNFRLTLLSQAEN